MDRAWAASVGSAAPGRCSPASSLSALPCASRRSTCRATATTRRSPSAGSSTRASSTPSPPSRAASRRRRSTTSLAWLWSRPFGTGEVGLRSLSALAGTRLDRRRLPRRAGAAAAPPGRPDRGRGRRRQPGPDLVLPGRPRLRARLPPHRALLPLLRPRAARRRAAGPRLVGGLLGPGARHPLLRRLRRHPRGRVLLLLSGPQPAPRVAAGAAVAIARGRRRCCCRSRCARRKTPTPAGSPNSRWAERLERAGGEAGRATTTATSTASASRARSRSAIPRRAGARRAGAAALRGGEPRGAPRRRGRRRGRASPASALPLLLGASRRRLPRRAQPASGLRAADRPRSAPGSAVRRAGWAGLGLRRRLLPLLARLHDRDRPPAAAAARGPAQRRRTRSGRCGPDTAVVTIRYAANQPLRYYLGARFACGSCRRCARSTWSARPAAEPPAPAASCRPPSAGSSRSRSPTTSP